MTDLLYYCRSKTFPAVTAKDTGTQPAYMALDTGPPVSWLTPNSNARSNFPCKRLGPPTATRARDIRHSSRSLPPGNTRNRRLWIAVPTLSRRRPMKMTQTSGLRSRPVCGNQLRHDRARPWLLRRREQRSRDSLTTTGLDTRSPIHRASFLHNL